MKSKFIGYLFFLGILPVLIVGGAGLYSLLSQAPPPRPAQVSTAPDLATAQAKLTQAAADLLKSIQTTVTDIQTLSGASSEAEYQAFSAAHPGVAFVCHLAADGRVLLVNPPGSTLMDATYAATEEFQNIRTRAADPNNPWPYQFYSRRAGAAFIFIQKLPDGTFVGAQVDIAYFFKAITPAAGGEGILVDAGSGMLFYHSEPAKMYLPFNMDNDPTLASVLTDLQSGLAGSKTTPQNAVVFAPLGVGAFGLVQILSLQALAPVATPAPAQDGLTLDKVLAADPDTMNKLFRHPLVLAFLGAIGLVLVAGFLLMSGFLKPLKAAKQILETAASGQGKISEEALRKVATPEVVAMLVASSQWAERLEREKESLGHLKDDEIHKVQGQLQSRAKEMADLNQKLDETRSVAEQKEQQLTDKLKEVDALKGMAEGLRNQGEQARGEIAKMKTQMTSQEVEHKKSESTLRLQLEQQAKTAEQKTKELESKLLQVVAAASSINVSRVRVAAVKTMSEELKTTLGIIKGYVSSALGSAQGGITEKQQEFLGMVINRSARLEKFINDLVDIFQVEIEQDGAARDEVSLASEIEGLAFNFQPQADIKSIKIRVEEKGTVAKVPIVRRRFTQLWNILYLQIIKDAPRGAQVPVTVEQVGEDVKVTVTDPGLVVKPEHLSQVFDEFYDPKHPASTQLAGTGLKFALVKTILAAHGGGAMAEKAEAGTRLILTFPTKIKKKENPAETMLAGMKKAAPTGGLLGAVKPGVVATPTMRPAVTPIPPKPTITSTSLESMMSGPPGTPKVAVPRSPLSGPAPARAPIPIGGMDSILNSKPSAAPPRPAGAPMPPRPMAPPGVPPRPAASPGVPPPRPIPPTVPPKPPAADVSGDLIE